MDGIDSVTVPPDSAQAIDSLGIYLLYELNRFMPEIDVGLYRNDVLLICRGAAARK